MSHNHSYTTEEKDQIENSRLALTEALDGYSVEYQLIEHEAVFTVGQMKDIIAANEGFFVKNLFLKGKKTGTLYLVTAIHDTKIDLKMLAKQLGEKAVRFASNELLRETLNVLAGSVNPFSLYFDAEKRVQCVFEEMLLNSGDQIIFAHPMDNSFELGIRSRDLNRLIRVLWQRDVVLLQND